MATIDVRAFMRATPQRVWQVASDLAAQAAWMEDVRRLEVLGEPQSGVGAKVRLTSDLFGLPVVREEMEVTAWEPPRRLAVVHRGRGFSGSGAFSLQPLYSGTEFIWQEELRPALGPLGELAFRLFVAPSLRRSFGRSLDNLRRLVEAGAKP